MLDGTAIFDTAEAAIFKARDARQERAYFAKALHLFLATTNLRGVPYRILYTGSDDPTEGHVMMLHGDRIHYEFQGVGTNTFTSPWLKGYGEKGIPISPPQFAEAKVRHAFLEASLCTGALPLGLPARLVERQTADFASRAWPYRLDEKIQNIVPNWPSRCNGTRDYVVSYAGSDGGIIDNEPFELARWTLMADPNAHHEPSARHTDRAVVIVDPF